MAARALPRFTQDIDIAVAVDSDRAAEELIHSFLQDGYHAEAAIEHEAVDRLATVRLERAVVPEEEVVVDLLFASSGIEPEIAGAATRLEIVPGLVLPVALTGHMMALKLLAHSESRPQDLADLHALAAVATPEDWTVARDAARLITERGYNRGRDLITALEQLQSGQP
jgi:predicted nucleotidyltransferase